MPSILRTAVAAMALALPFAAAQVAAARRAPGFPAGRHR